MSRQTDLSRSYHERWSEKFWLEDPSVLFRRWVIFPNCEMNTVERLNALTRLILVITLILWLLGGFGVRWWLFGILGLVFVLIIWQVTRPRSTYPDQQETDIEASQSYRGLHPLGIQDGSYQHQRCLGVQNVPYRGPGTGLLHQRSSTISDNQAQWSGDRVIENYRCSRPSVGDTARLGYKHWSKTGSGRTTQWDDKTPPPIQVWNKTPGSSWGKSSDLDRTIFPATRPSIRFRSRR